MDDFRTPEWVKDAVFYQIFPDRFARSDRLEKPGSFEPWDSPPTVYGFKGGDLAGVAEHLGHLQDLGITAIYFNPIFQSAANHRYHTYDYFHVDPLLGGDAAFDNLLAEAHRKGIRIVLDGVFNHASRGFFPFNHILENGSASPYLDWFTVYRFPLNAYEGSPGYQSWLNLPALPKFNTGNPRVRQYLFRVARYWLEKGIDGWRLDVPHEINDDSFWREFRRMVKAANPEAYIVGEIVHEAQHWLQGDMFDAVMNYQFTQACLGFFGGESINWSIENNFMGLPPTRVLDAAAFAHRVEQLRHIYPREAVLAQLNLLGSHDMPRFSSLAGGRQDLYRLAVLFQMTYPGAPCIYYGDEIGLADCKGPYPEAARGAFPWDRSRWDLDLLEQVKRYIALRKAHPALRRGEFTTLFAQGQVLAYQRRLDEEKLIVVINNQSREYHLKIYPSENLPEHLPEHLPEGSHWQDELSGAQAFVQDGALQGTVLPPKSGMVFVEPDSQENG